MDNPNNPVFKPLVAAAVASVIAFSGIGIAAITGHLSITHSNLNPFSSFSKSAASGIIQSPVIPTDTHVGLARHRGETQTEGKPVNYRFGARLPVRKSVCADCGVVDSITSRQVRPAAPGVSPSQASGSDSASVLRVGTQAREVGTSSNGADGFVVIVHMENGTVRTIYESDRPSFSIGERIKLVNGVVIRLG